MDQAKTTTHSAVYNYKTWLKPFISTPHNHTAPHNFYFDAMRVGVQWCCTGTGVQMNGYLKPLMMDWCFSRYSCMCLGQTACNDLPWFRWWIFGYYSNHDAMLCLLTTGHPHRNSLQTCPYLWQARQREAQERHWVLWQCWGAPREADLLEPDWLRVFLPGFRGSCEEWDPSIGCSSGQEEAHLWGGSCPLCELWGCGHGGEGQSPQHQR